MFSFSSRLAHLLLVLRPKFSCSYLSARASQPPRRAVLRGVRECRPVHSGAARIVLSSPQRVVLYLFSGLTIALIVATVVLAILYNIDWSALTPSLAALVLMLGFLYWTTTLLPGPVKRLGKAAGRQVMRSIRKDKQK